MSDLESQEGEDQNSDNEFFAGSSENDDHDPDHPSGSKEDTKAESSKKNIDNSPKKSRKTKDSEKRPTEIEETKTPSRRGSLKEDISVLGPEENVRVVVRVRPMNKSEIQKQCHDIVTVNKETNGIELRQNEMANPKCYRFDAVFSPDTSQADVYNLVARPIVQNVIEGYNGTIFAYGQTGTGKTFTMEGNNDVPELKGIIPNSFAQIFSHISHASGERRFLVRVSYLEIYNEDVRDLLSKDSPKKLEVRERVDSGVYVKELSSFVVRNADEMDRIMTTGNKNRSVGSTNMNAVSSRSHAIFTIRVEASIENGDGSLRSIRMGKLNLVDLAGSERIAKSGATGQRLKEGAKINLSLSCLGNVISALVEGHSHIPYRSSKLTRLLQDSLGGNSKTVMCANIGPADYNYDETLSTLRYADRAKQIRNHARINEDPKDALLRQFQNEIEALRRQLQEEGGEFDGSKTRTEQRTDSDDEEGEEDDEDENFLASEVSHLMLVPSQEAVKGIRGELQTYEQLATTVEVDTKERHSALHALKKNVETWKQHEEKRAVLQEKLRSIKRKIMVGGENLLDKSQQQEEFLQRSMQELDQRKKEELKLRNTLSSKKVEMAKSEARILQLQAENTILNKKLKKCWKLYLQEKGELDLMVEDCTAQEETMLEDINRYSKELKFINHVINETIPASYQELIEKSCGWNDDTGRWSLPCIAYTGNNIHRSVTQDSHYKFHSQLNRKLKDLSFLQPSLFESTESKGEVLNSKRPDSSQIFERRQIQTPSHRTGSANCPDIQMFNGDSQQPQPSYRKGKGDSLKNIKSPPLSQREN